MKPTDRLLRELPAALPPTVNLPTVAEWVRTGRPRRRFHLLAWLTRVCRLPLN